MLCDEIEKLFEDVVMGVMLLKCVKVVGDGVLGKEDVSVVFDMFVVCVMGLDGMDVDAVTEEMKVAAAAAAWGVFVVEDVSVNVEVLIDVMID